MKKFFLMMTTIALLMSACTSKKINADKTLSGLYPENFKTEIDGKNTQLYILKNQSGMEVCITNFGGRIVSVMVPDKKGNMKDVVLGFDSIQDYINIPSDFGAIIGRYANRINQGRIVIDNKTIQLPQNNYGHCLHGGPHGWQYQVFDGEQIDSVTLKLKIFSPDGDANFPGNMTATVIYKLLENNSIDISYQAECDQKTIVNLTNHSYFNLSGDPKQSIVNQFLTLNSSFYTPIDSTFMTTGEILSVEQTPMDFRIQKLISTDITNYDNIQIKNGHGYDHNWVLNKTQKDNTQTEWAAKLFCPETGIVLDVCTNEPGIQVYTGNFLDGSVIGKKNIAYQQRMAICLETQHYPDSPNKLEWPSVILEPGQIYHSHCVYHFGIE